jgi:hypothetical protein
MRLFILTNITRLNGLYIILRIGLQKENRFYFTQGVLQNIKHTQKFQVFI